MKTAPRPTERAVRSAPSPRGWACRRLLPVALALGLALVGGSARASSTTRDADLNGETTDVIGGGDVHAYRLSLVSGTALRLRVRDADAQVSLTLRSPAGDVIAVDTARDARIDRTVRESGVFRVELTTSAAATQYELEFRGTAPSNGGGGTTTTGGTIHIDTPRGAQVRIEARRVGRHGAAPEILAVRDGSGRAVQFRVARSETNRQRLSAIPVSAPGGIDIDVRGRDGGDGEYEVRYKLVDVDDGRTSHSGGERESRTLVLSLAAGADPATVAASLGYTLKSVGDGFIVVETPSDRDGFEYEDAVGADDASTDVIAAEPDTFLNAPEGTQLNAVVVGSTLGRADVQQQPALQAMRASAAMRTATGMGVVIAVLDSGIDATHPDLAGHVLPGKDFVGMDDDPSEEQNGLDDDGDGQVDEGFGHGTFIAGLALTVAPDAQILPVRVLDTDGRGTVSAIASGIEWAVANGANVINLSLGMDASSGVLGDAVRYAIANGITVVAATGNGGAPASISFPASVAGVVAVTAVDPAGAPAAFANGGPAATVAAPGQAVIGPYPGNQYGAWSGTSFSAGLASGGAALLVQTQPTITPAAVVRRMRNTARPAPMTLRPAQRRRLGGGRLDLARLVQ
ncbi:MAG: S8 family serine peptidase [Planctomycetes bacterium]|nr:S8 family serine peptidase [Planctomycetota bacterium]